jgi:hypothetical protein
MTSMTGIVRTIGVQVPDLLVWRPWQDSNLHLTD